MEYTTQIPVSLQRLPGTGTQQKKEVSLCYLSLSDNCFLQI